MDERKPHGIIERKEATMSEYTKRVQHLLIYSATRDLELQNKTQSLPVMKRRQRWNMIHTILAPFYNKLMRAERLTELRIKSYAPMADVLFYTLVLAQFGFVGYLVYLFLGMN
jgi:hypothetical protein